MLTNWKAYAVAAIVFVALTIVYNKSSQFRKLTGAAS